VKIVLDHLIISAEALDCLIVGGFKVYTIGSPS